MNIFDELLEAVKPIWDQYYIHPFVLGIQNGTLEKDRFKYYLIQDELYLKDYTRCFALGLAKAKSDKTTKLFSDYIQALTAEVDLHSGYYQKLAITKEDLETTKMNLDNLSYTSYMLRISYEYEEVEILAAILACAYSYELIAKKMIENKSDCMDDPFYGDWIKGYASKEYADHNVELISMFNELTKSITDTQKENLKEIFECCSYYELRFWENSYQKA